MREVIGGVSEVGRRVRSFHGKFYGLLISLIVLIMLAPFFEQTGVRRGVTGLLLTVILVSGVYSLSGNRRLYYIAIALAFPALAGQIFRAVTGQEVFFEQLAKLTILPFFVFVTLTILWQVLRGGKVTGDTICGAASVYLLLGLTWAVAYALLYSISPSSFAGNFVLDEGGKPVFSNFTYYSYVTLTTLGYGDTQPMTSQARTLSVMESVCGVLYIAILISRLVAMYGSDPEKEAAEG